MAKRLSKEEAIVKVLDKVNLLKNPESADIEKYMNGYAALRCLEGQEREDAYDDIVFALFGDRLQPKTAAEQAEKEWTEAVDQDDMDRATFYMVATHPGLQLVPMEPAQVPAVVEDTAIEVVEPVAEAKETVTVTATEAPKRATINKEAVLGVLRAIWAALPVIGATVVSIIKSLIAILAWVADKMISVYYAVTTYIPIWGRSIALHIAWFVQDSIPAVIRTGKAAWAGLRAFGGIAFEAGLMVAGWIATCIVVAVSVATKAAKVAVEGWNLREEIISESKAA